jgi:transcriptional regulator with XRE-family HTH domain
MASRARGIGKSIYSARQGAFCALLIAARKNAGLTQQEVSRRLKRPQSFVAKFEGGERRLDVVEFLDVAKAIEADPVRIIRKLMRHTG